MRHEHPRRRSVRARPVRARHGLASAPAPRRRPAVAQVLAVTAVTGAVVALTGGGQILLLSVPAALLAAARTRTRAGAAAAAAAVVGAAVAAAVAATGGHGSGARPSPAVLALAAAGAVTVLVAVRERLVREREVLRDYALSDPVTGVANRRSLLMRAEYEMARHRRAQRSFALVMLDLDGFKQLNDRFGHAAGDDLLRDVAAALRRAMRAQDTVARFGGDEFCVLAPETDERGVPGLAERVSHAVREVSVGMDSVGGSVGVAIFPRDGRTIEDLMHSADVRLLGVKRRRPASRTQRRAA